MKNKKDYRKDKVHYHFLEESKKNKKKQTKENTNSVSEEKTTGNGCSSASTKT